VAASETSQPLLLKARFSKARLRRWLRTLLPQTLHWGKALSVIDDDVVPSPRLRFSSCIESNSLQGSAFEGSICFFVTLASRVSQTL
jgi:hypothetical protein